MSARRASRAPASRSGRRGLVAALLLALGLAGGLAVHRSVAGTWSPPPPVEDRPLEVRDGGYVSSQACRSCHPREHATWEGSYHRSMTQVATPDTVLAPIDGEPQRVYGRTFELRWRGSELWVREGESERRIVMTTGSHHFQAYWLETGDGRKIELFELAYQTNLGRGAPGRWMPFDDLPLTPPGFRQTLADGGEWNTTCIQCHSTAGRSRALGPEPMDTLVAELGIACESCHGPGEEHVAVNRNPWRRYIRHFTGSDPTIINPERLDSRRASQVCGQCHSVRAPYATDELLAWVEEGSPYRPGDDLEASRRIVHRDLPGSAYGTGESRLDSVLTSFWPDGTVRPNGREYNSFLRSRCFTEGELSCSTCHRLHPPADDPRPLAAWAADQLRGDRTAEEACLFCHQDLATAPAVEAHSHHPAGTPGASCMNCHMPNIAWGLQKATRTHQIGNPRVRPDPPRDLEGTHGARPNACNLCHLDRSQGWAADHLSQWYGQPRPTLAGEDESVAAGVRWALSGDAAQRAVVAWTFGWEPAQQASGVAWMPPYLGMLMMDPYAAVRSAAGRSLVSLPGFGDLDYDYTAGPEARGRALARMGEVWIEGGAGRSAASPAVLLDPQGLPQQAAVDALLARRDDRPIYVTE